MEKVIKKILTAVTVGAIVAQTAAVPTFAKAAAVLEYKETVKSELNVSNTFGTNATTLNLGTGYTTGAGSIETQHGEIAWDEANGAIKLKHNNNSEKKGMCFYSNQGISQADGYIEGEIKCSYDKTASVSYTQPIAQVLGGSLYTSGFRTVMGDMPYTYGEWLGYRLVYDYDESDKKYDIELYFKKDGKYTLVKKETDKELSGTLGAWANGGQIGVSGDVKDAELYVKKAKVAVLNSGADSVFPQIVSMKETSDGLELKVNIALDEKSVTKENLDIPTGTVTDVSYADKTITIKGTGIKAAFLTENILSADGMPTKTSSFESNVKDSIQFKWDIANYASGSNNVSNENGTKTYVPANAETGERAYLDMEAGAYAYARANISQEGYFDWGVKTTGSHSTDWTKVQTQVGNLGIKLQGGKWQGDGFSGVADNHQWMDFRMLVRKNAEGKLERKWLLKNDDGVYEDIGTWTVGKDKDNNEDSIGGWFTASAGDGMTAQMSKFEYTNAAESTWYPEIIGQESYLDGKLLRIYTNRPLLGSTVNADSVILASGTATDFITSGNVITIVGNGLTSAELKSGAATAEGLRGARAEVVPIEADSINYLDSQVQCTFDRPLKAYEVDLLKQVKLVCTGTDEEAQISTEYNKETNTLIVKYGELTSVCYSPEEQATGAAKYKLVLPEKYFENSSYTYSVQDSTVYQYLNVGKNFDTENPDIAFSLTEADKTDGQGYKASFVDRNEAEREHIKATGDILTYGMKSMFYSEFYIDMCVNAEDISENGWFRQQFANCNGKDGSWTDSIAKVGKKAWAGNDKIYVGDDGYAEIRICFQKDSSSYYLKSIYSKDKNGVYRIASEPNYIYTYENMVLKKVSRFSYMTTTGSEGVKINAFKLYKENISKTIPKITAVSYSEDGAEVVFSRHMRADSVVGENLTLYNSEGNIITDAKFSYNDLTKTLSITNSGAIDRIVFSKNIAAVNGMSIEEGTEVNAYTESALKINDTDGELLTNIVGVRQAKAEMTIENHNPNNIGKKKTAVIAAYDENERLIGAAYDTKEIKNGTINLCAELSISGEAAKFKAFLWDGTFEEMRSTGASSVTVPGTQSISIESIGGAYDTVILKADSDVAYVRGIKTKINTPISKNGVLLAAAEDLAEFTLSRTEGDCDKLTVYYTDKEITFSDGDNAMSITDITKQTTEEKELTTAATSVDGKLYVPVKDYIAQTDLKLNPYITDYAVFGSGGLTNKNLVGNESKILSQLFSEKFSDNVMTRFYVDQQATENTADTFKTINDAVWAVRNYKQAHGMTGDIEVLIKDGVYYTNGISLNAEDGGENGCNVIYKAYPGASPRIISGEKISGFEEYENGIYRAKTDKTDFYLLSENGTAAHKARYPDEGYNKTAKPATAKNTEFSFNTGEIPSLKNPQGAEVSIWPGGESGTSSWSHKFMKISDIDYSNRKVYFVGNSGTVIGKNTRYFVQDDYNLLNCAGEFFADGEYLYYKPYSESISESEIYIPNKADIFSLTGSTYEHRIKNIKFSGLSFEGADNDYHAIDILYGSGIDISDCKFKNIGGSGVNVQKSYDVNVSDSEFLNIGYSGVNISGMTLVKNTIAGYNKIYSNYFDGMGRVEQGESAGIGLSAVDHCYVANNRINDCPRFGIKINSNKSELSKTNIAYEEWDDYTRGCYSVIENNDISNACNDSNDGGGIYMWCAGVGNVVRQNRIHHSSSPYSYWFPMYLDDGSNKTTIYKNVIDNNQCEETEGYIMYACFIKGIGNVMLNNIVVNNQNYEGADKNFANFGTHSMGNLANDKVENFQNVYYNSGHNIVHIEPSVNNALTKTPMTTRIAKQDKNLYYNDEHIYLPDVVRKDYANRYEDIGTVNGKSDIETLADWKAWQNGRYDQQSLFDQNPQFVNVSEEDFRFNKNSPVYGIGFDDIDFGAIGLAKDSSLSFAKDFLENVYIISEKGKNSCEKLSVGEGVILSATGRTQKGVYIDKDNAQVSWNSSDNAVAEVAQNGYVTAKKAGNATITATISHNGITKSISMEIEVK